MKKLDLKEMEKFQGGKCSYNDDQEVVLTIFAPVIGWGLIWLCDKR